MVMSMIMQNLPEITGKVKEGAPKLAKKAWGEAKELFK